MGRHLPHRLQGVPIVDVSVTPLVEASATYQLRFDPCDLCDTAVTWSCEQCGGTDEVLAGCCVCNVCKPLDDDGYCRDCLAPSLGLPAGWERIAF